MGQHPGTLGQHGKNLQSGLVLSRFDKNGVAYASLQDFALQVSVFLNSQIVHDILLGLSTNALWDVIKQSSFYIWTKLKLRYYSLPKEAKSAQINFGLKVQIDPNTILDLKLDGEVSESTILQALDKVTDLLKTTSLNDRPSRERFFIYSPKNDLWEEVDVLKELSKMAKKNLHKRGPK